jgi:hypothetical protein
MRAIKGISSPARPSGMSTGTTWQPSPEMQLLLTNLTGLLAVDSVSLQFLPTGTTTLRIDDGYLDPWKST